MKQMRSRFRLLALLLACAFLLAMVLCAGKALKTAEVTLSSLSSITSLVTTASPDPSSPPDESAESPPPASRQDGNPSPGTDNPPDQEYNIFGL